MKVYLATDHAGFSLKESIYSFLEEKGFDVEDCGAYEEDEGDDFPDFIAKAGEKVSENPESFGIIFGGSGMGEAMVANKFPGVRCAVFYGPELAKSPIDVVGNKSKDPFEIVRLTREHNNANILSLGARFLSDEDAKKAVEVFLGTPFSNAERHKRRVDKITAIEERLS